MTFSEKPEAVRPNAPDDDGDVYAAQREELIALLKSGVANNEPLRVHDKTRLSSDEMAVVLQKVKNGYGFSRKERGALTEAGFALDKLFPKT